MAGIEYEVCRKACPWVGNIPCHVPYLKAGWFRRGIPLPSHFAIPIGIAVWLATLIQCLTAFPNEAWLHSWLPYLMPNGIPMECGRIVAYQTSNA